MSNSILVVIGFYNDITKVTEIINKLIDDNVYSSIYLVGKEYRQLSISDLPYEVTVIPDDPVRVFSSRSRVPINGVYPSFQANMHYSSYYKRMEFIKDSTTPMTIACVDTSLASNIFNLAALIFTENLDSGQRRWLIVDDIDLLISNKGIPIPNIFKGDEDIIKIRDDVLSQHERYNMKYLIIQGIDILRECLGAGYYFLENNKQVPGWVLHIGTPWNSLLIGMFKIISGSIDKTQQQEMIESAYFRQLITKITLGILSNYVMNTFNVDVSSTFTPSIKDLKKYHDEHFSILFGDDVNELQKQSREKILKETKSEFIPDVVAWTNKKLWDELRVKYISNDLIV